MRHSVYPFGLILKELRRDAGLTVLTAAEATEYGNYERWESGATRVGAQYLRIIAQAFGVTDELWLLLYAWLVDRWTPTPGERALDLARVNASRVLRDLPVNEFAADTTATNLVLGSIRHLDVALLCLGARYQRGKRVVLMPVRRSLPPDRGPGESVLQATYADVVVDGLRRVSRALFARGGCGVESPEFEEPGLVPNMAPVLTSPEAFEVLADELGGPLETEARWFGGMLRTQQQTLRAMVGAARGEPVTPEAVAQFVEDVAVGHRDRVGDVLVAAARSEGLAEADPRLTAELAAMGQRVAARSVRQVQRELAGSDGSTSSACSMPSTWSPTHDHLPLQRPTRPAQPPIDRPVRGMTFRPSGRTVDAMSTSLNPVPSDRPDPPWLDAEEVAPLLCTTAHTLRRLARENRCPIVVRRIGGRWRFSRRDLARFLSDDLAGEAS